MKISPAIRFLMVFAGSYLLLNLGYGLYIESTYPSPDRVTAWVSRQVRGIALIFDRPTQLQVHAEKPTVVLSERGKTIVNIYEGCNGVNVAIVFVSFILAFGGRGSIMAWFLPLGLVLIHGVNVARLLVLYALSVNGSRYFYYFHKYLFTAIIFSFVFLLWYFWMRLNAKTIKA